MTAFKKGHSETPEVINSRIQRKFDQVFSGGKKKADEADGAINLSMVTDSSPNYSESDMSSSANKKEDADPVVIDLDFSISDDADELNGDFPQTKNASVQPISMSESSSPKTVPSDDGELDFSIDFDSVDEIMQENLASPDDQDQKSDDLKTDFEAANPAMDGIDLENLPSEFDENTQKTIIMNTGTKAKVDVETFSLSPEDDQISTQSTADQMTSAEDRSNIESTIIGIISPKAESSTDEIDYSKMSNQDNTSSSNFSLDQLSEDNGSEEFALEVGSHTQQAESGATGEFFIDPLELDAPAIELDAPTFVNMDGPKVVEKPAVNKKEEFTSSSNTLATKVETPSVDGFGRLDFKNDEDSVRVHATIRQLREEREELLGQIKHLKSEQKELEQDNLSLKAGLDEAKIEISILRKRHMVEMEDIKYRLTLSEEKKVLAEEKSRQTELRREKLEQKVRIDYNQVKLREKELESKLEMLSMDIDSQVHSRDHKILELRRKIDALEFNMENASIKEQRSNEDRRKLEDKLNKIMKTLRNSIKNLEEDIDLVQEDLTETEKN